MGSTESRLLAPTVEHDTNPNGDFTLTFDPNLQRELLGRRPSRGQPQESSQSEGNKKESPGLSEEALKEAYNAGLQHMHHRMQNEHHEMMSRMREQEVANTLAAEEEEAAAMNAVVAELQSAQYTAPQNPLACGAEREACTSCLAGVNKAEGQDARQCRAFVDAYVSCARAQSDALLEKAVA